MLFDDQRGTFLEAFSVPALLDAIGVDFRVAQANTSISREGVLRGLHFADVPPGQAKLVTAVVGTVFDVIVDIRLGSPTFGEYVAVTLSAEQHNSVYLAEGLAHGFLALEPEATVSYLVSSPYNPGAEHTIDPFDAKLGIDWPVMAMDGSALDYILSDKDRTAPSLLDVAAAGNLPSWQECSLLLP